MERIGQIGMFDLENPETRLAVHLALKIRRLLAGNSVRGANGTSAGSHAPTVNRHLPNGPESGDH
jgi:hypothetical protein